MSDPPPPDLPVTPERIASWLLHELARRDGVLREDVAALEIVRLFGGDFCARRGDGTLRITVRVRHALERLAVFGAKRVLWDDVERVWRFGHEPPDPYR